MARPIAATPVLTGEDLNNFLVEDAKGFLSEKQLQSAVGKGTE